MIEVIDNLISKVEDLNSSISKYSDSTSKLKKFESLRGKIQQKISSILSSVDDKISELQIKKTSLESLKKGLMQKLLTGQIRVKT